MLTQANFINEKWNVGLPRPITADQVTYFGARPKVKSFGAGIVVSNRFGFEIGDGMVTAFRDSYYWWRDLETDSRRMESLRKMTNLLTKTTALHVAQDALRRLGLTEKELHLPQFRQVSQFEYEPDEFRKYPLPLYRIEWKRSKDPESGALMEMEVSGVNGKVVSWINYAAAPLPLPTNYYQMLGVSPRRNEWGKEFGYDPLNTDEFQKFARRAATEQINHLKGIWNLDSAELSTNDITWFLATAKSNSFDFSAQFGERFYLQTGGGKIQLFEDKAHNVDAFAGDDEKMKKASVATDLLNVTTAVEVARESLHKMGLQETQLQLIEPPTVKQWTLPSGEDGNGPVYKLPLYDVFWLFPEKERARYGEGAAAIAFQISGATKKVAMYANNSPLTPKLSLPTNYFEILGIGSRTNYEKN